MSRRIVHKQVEGNKKGDITEREPRDGEETKRGTSTTGAGTYS